MWLVAIVFSKEFCLRVHDPAMKRLWFRRASASQMPETQELHSIL